MNKYPELCTIRIKGSLHERWKDWFEGMTLTNLDNGEIQLQGSVHDQSELLGILNQIHSLNLKLISVICKSGTEKI